MAYKVFSIGRGVQDGLQEGALVEEYPLSTGVVIPVLAVGEQGRGRELGILPVSGAKPSDQLVAADVVEVSGRSKLVAADEATNKEATIVVLHTMTGFRGSNAHTGDVIGWRCRSRNCTGPREMHPVEFLDVIPEKCPDCGWHTEMVYAPRPGKVLARGVIAEGAAGRAGSGEQFILLLPRDEVLRTAYTGRLYGGPEEHYLWFDGEKIIRLTCEERVLFAMMGEGS